MIVLRVAKADEQNTKIINSWINTIFFILIIFKCKEQKNFEKTILPNGKYPEILTFLSFPYQKAKTKRLCLIFYKLH